MPKGVILWRCMQGGCPTISCAGAHSLSAGARRGHSSIRASCMLRAGCSLQNGRTGHDERHTCCCASRPTPSMRPPMTSAVCATKPCSIGQAVRQLAATPPQTSAPCAWHSILRVHELCLRSPGESCKQPQPAVPARTRSTGHAFVHLVHAEEVVAIVGAQLSQLQDVLCCQWGNLQGRLTSVHTMPIKCATQSGRVIASLTSGYRAISRLP